MKAVLLAGGLGTRLREETDVRPKPMVNIGDRPILWHIMKNLSVQGITDFIVATGYKADVIKDYFVNYETLTSDVTVTLGNRHSLVVHGNHDEVDWNITVAYTGDLTNTGGRVLRVRKYLDDEPFFLTYGDGVADISLVALQQTHRQHGKTATISTMQPMSRFGVIDFDDSGDIQAFREKPRLDGWINIGFMILEPRALDYFTDDCVLESGPLAEMAQAGELAAYRHEGYWQPMDTYRESTLLNDLWASGQAPWKNW